jgi:ankyrin repeat protein
MTPQTTTTDTDTDTPPPMTTLFVSHEDKVGKMRSISNLTVMENTTASNTITNSSSGGNSGSRRPGLERIDDAASTGSSRNLVAKSGGAAVFSNIRTATDRVRVLEENVFGVFFPWNKHYKTWWGFTVCAAIFTIFFETYEIAFPPAGLPNLKDASSIIEYLLLSIFLIDMGINFNRAFYDDHDELIYDRKSIAKNYLRFMFWVDFVGIFPFYAVLLACTGQMGQNSRLAQYLQLVRLVRMVRLYRVRQLFEVLQYSSKVSLLWMTLIRNFAVACVWTHFSACTIYFISRMYHFGENTTFIGGVYGSLTRVERYITSLYWSCVTFYTVGYGDYSPANAMEELWCIFYMTVNMVISAWIIGSITLLIVRNDEKTGAFREALQKLDQYCSMHSFEKLLKKRLKTAIKLSFQNQEIADETLVKHFPSAIRRKVLHRLYLPSLVRTSLMKGIRQQFVDAFLTACTVELFSPGEEILQRGSVASDLYLIVGGSVELLPVNNKTFDSMEDVSNYRSASIADSDYRSVHGGGPKQLTAGDFINEIGFFTESPQIDTVRTVTVCKTLTMSRSAYKQLCDDHPGSCGMILENLLAKVNDLAEAMRFEPGVHLPKRLEVLRAGSVFDDTSGHTVDVQRTVARVQTQAALSSIQELVKMHINKLHDDHTTRFLFAASRGDTTTISLMCDQGFDPNSADYDNRTALMVAAMKGNTNVVTKLLDDYEANPNLVDVHGSSALYEAVKNGNETTMEELLKHNATLCMDEKLAASTLCQLVFDGDTLTLRRMLRAKIQVNAADYDKRTPAHIAAAEGNVLALKVLVEFGADLTAKDRWKYSIHDEAQKANAGRLLEYLQTLRSGS